MKSVLFVLLVFTELAFAGYPIKPNPSQTPGELCSRGDHDYGGDRYREKIPYCNRNVERPLKTRIYAEYGIPNECRHSYIIDHFYPLSMGGNNSKRNLWPEHDKIRALRADLELVTFERLRDGEINQKEALDIIREAKMNPPVKFLEDMIFRGNDCDRQAAMMYLEQ